MKQVPLRRTGLTDPQLKVLRAVREHIKKHRLSPTYDEVAAAVSRGKSTIRHTIARLIRKGMLSATPGRFRTLVITEQGLAAATNGRKRRK